MSERAQALEAALRALRNECHAIKSMSYDEIKASAGYTNLKCWMDQMDEVDALLAVPPPPPVGSPTTEHEHDYVAVELCRHCLRTEADITGECHHCDEGTGARCWWCFKLKSTPVEPAGAHVETLRQMVGMAGEFRQTLLTVRECIDALTPGHRTGYDWNADPLYMTRYVGDALKAIDAGLKSLNGQAAVPTYRNVYIVTHYPDGGLRGVHASQAGAEAEIADLCREYPKYSRRDFSVTCDRIRPFVEPAGASEPPSEMDSGIVLLVSAASAASGYLERQQPDLAARLWNAVQLVLKSQPAPVSPVAPEPPTETRSELWEVREQLAALAHEQWAGWMAHVFRKCEQREGGWWMPAEWADRWLRQIATPYLFLTPSEQDSDRKEAERVLGVMLTVAPTGAPAPCVWRPKKRMAQAGCPESRHVNADGAVLPLIDVLTFHVCPYCKAPLTVER